MDFHGEKLALDTGAAGRNIIFWEKFDLPSALVIWSFTTVAQCTELSEFLTLKMLCSESVSDWSDILGGHRGECLLLAKKMSVQSETLLQDSILTQTQLTLMHRQNIANSKKCCVIKVLFSLWSASVSWWHLSIHDTIFNLPRRYTIQDEYRYRRYRYRVSPILNMYTM